MNSKYKLDKITLLTKRDQNDFISPSSEESLWHLSGGKIDFDDLHDFVLNSLYYIFEQENKFLAYGINNALDYYKEHIKFNFSSTGEEVHRCVGNLKEKISLLNNIKNSWCLYNNWNNVIILNETYNHYEFIFWETTA